MKVFLAIVSTLVTAWLGSTWYAGAETEKLVRQSPSMEVIDYDRGLTHSTAKFRMPYSIGIPVIDRFLDDVQFVADISHGPVNYSSGGIFFGAADWLVSIDRDSITGTVLEEIIETNFSGNSPVLLETRFDYSGNGHFTIGIPEITVTDFDKPIGKLSRSEFAGSFDSVSQQGHLSGKTGLLQIDDSKNTLNVPPMDVEARLDDLVEERLFGSLQVQTGKVVFKTRSQVEEISFQGALQLQQKKLDDDIKGHFQLAIDDAYTPGQMINGFKLDLDYDNLKIPDPVYWKADPFMLLSEFLSSLQAGKSGLQLAVNMVGAQGKARLDLDAAYTDDTVTLLRGLDSKLVFEADSVYLDKTPLAYVLFSAIESGVIRKEDNTYHLDVTLHDGNARVNDEPWRMQDIVKVLFPWTVEVANKKSGSREPAKEVR